MVTVSVGILTTWRRMSLEKLILVQIINKLAAEHKSQGFIIFAATCQQSLYSAR